MKKVLMKYIGKHQPNNVIEVLESKSKELIKTGDYIFIEDVNVNKDKRIKPSNAGLKTSKNIHGS